ncbi:MAG: hypothetical protein ISS29_06015 [Candidatus Marinimicrobia bacterium]|nr:hypothetical protein [Candidatus Neomarinimicrobiota bacterium]
MKFQISSMLPSSVYASVSTSLRRTGRYAGQVIALRRTRISNIKLRVSIHAVSGD